MKVLFRFLLFVFMALPLAACGSDPGALNKNQDPNDPAGMVEHDEESTELPPNDPPP